MKRKPHAPNAEHWRDESLKANADTGNNTHINSKGDKTSSRTSTRKPSTVNMQITQQWNIKYASGFTLRPSIFISKCQTRPWVGEQMVEGTNPKVALIQRTLLSKGASNIAWNSMKPG